MKLRIEQFPQIRAITRPQPGLRALVERAPQAQAVAAYAVKRLHPAVTWIYEARRRLSTTAVAVLTAWLFLHVMFGANGMVVYRQKRAEYQNLQKEMEDLQKENDSFTQQVKALRTNPQTIEKEAREQLHYTRPGEVVFVAPSPALPQIRAGNAARK
jgi:cell division protein FtsB